MLTAISPKERKELLLTNFPGESVMDCSFHKLYEICSNTLNEYDDLIQKFHDENNHELSDEFSEAYVELEKLCFHLYKGEVISKESRNKLRMFLKHYQKLQTVKLN